MKEVEEGKWGMNRKEKRLLWVMGAQCSMQIFELCT